jgi:hypothetical protein
MNSKERKEKIKPNAVFMIGGKKYQILKVEDSNAVVRDLATNNKMNYGVDALSKLNITLEAVKAWNTRKGD